MKLLPLTLTASILLALAPTGISIADDSEMFRKNLSGTADLLSEHAAIRVLPLYVPAQNTSDELVTIEYFNYDGDAIDETREYARPLIAHYTDGHVEGIDEEGYGGFPGHGERDAFAAVSLDDGATWKTTNLSKSGNLSSIRIKLGGRQKIDYPGDVGRTAAASDGNKVLIVWVSRYARGGNPNYAMLDDERAAVAEHLFGEGTDAAGACTDDDLITTPCLYLEDIFAVAGSQGTSDMADEGLPLIGELPYAAVWAARGVMLPPVEEDGLSTFVWFKAERLSSAVRDANRPEAVCVKGAGCTVTWQEDPDGMRPGEGEGPGEGWSGAIAHHQTDIWYSYISWDDFDLVADTDYGTFYNETGDLAEWVAANDTGTPNAAIPMAIPVRLTDNSMCVAEGDKPYCYADFDAPNEPGYGTPDFCATTETVVLENEGGGQTLEMCVTEDGRLMRGNIASTRARQGLHGYSTLGDYRADPAAYPIDSAWFYMAYEENKGLGECDDEGTKTDMGKNIWYHTFNMFEPELVSQGLMLNAPAIYPDDFSDTTGTLLEGDLFDYNFFIISPDPIYMTEAGLDTTTLYQTEIARRSSPISQDWYDAGVSNTVALQLWKQGIVRRGGPADISGRRFVRPPDGVVGDPTYELCTTVEECTTTYKWCEIAEVCVDNDPNPDYNKGQCRKYETPELCFRYLDGDDNPTEDPQTCTQDTTCFTGDICPVDPQDCTEIPNCEDTTTCESVGNCDDGTYDPDIQVCTTIPGEIEDGFDPTEDNPYDYANMVCENLDGTSGWAFTDTVDDKPENPRYVKGMCAAPAINLSGTTIVLGEDECTDAESCLGIYPFNETFDDLEGGLPISRILEWEMLGPGYEETITETALTNLDDASWENPYDVAKGHRGFMTGDMVMVMYAASANWKALTDAHDVFNLYNRRSFDGGKTWSTLPESFLHTNGETYSGSGTTTCEVMNDGSEDFADCTTYLAGDFEQARNVSQLIGSQVTVLDPRYAPTARSITPASVSSDSLPDGFYAPEYLDDTRDPSRYFMVYETGDASAYDEGEAPPRDLFYSRAIEWGDQYLVWQETGDTSACLPSADEDDDFDMAGFCNEFDALEGHSWLESGEAAIASSPGGQFFYSTWNQEELDGEDVIESDVWFRRVLFLDGYIPDVDESQ